MTEPPKRTRWPKALAYFFAAAMGLALLCMIGVVLWLGTAPRQVGLMTPWLERQLKDYTKASSVSVVSPIIYLNSKKSRLEVELPHLHLALPKGVMEVDTLRVAAPLKALLRGAMDYEGFHVQQVSVMPSGYETPLHIQGLQVHPDAQEEGRTHFSVDMSGIAPTAALEGIIDRGDSGVTYAMNAHDIPAALIAVWVPEAAGLGGQISGEIHAMSPGGLSPTAVTAHLNIKNASFRHAHYYPDTPLSLDAVDMSVAWQRSTCQVTIQTLDIVRGEMRLNAEGAMQDDLSALQIEASLEHLQVDDVGKLWPHGVALEPRDWVTQRLSDGVVKHGKATVMLQPGMEVPSLKASLDVEGVTVTYVDHLPPARNARGKVFFTEDSMRIEVAKAQAMSGGVLTDGVLDVVSFSKGAIPMVITLPLEAPAKDVAAYLSAKHLNKGTELQLDPERIKGQVKGTIVLDFPLYPEKLGKENASSFDYLKTDIQAELQGVTQSGVLGAWNLKDFGGALALDNQQLTLKAQGQLQQVPAVLDITHHHGQTPADTDYSVSLQLPPEHFNAFGVPIPPEIVTGVTQLEADIHETSEKKTINATLDFTQAELDGSRINWQKPKGEAATLVVTQTIQGGHNHIDSMTFTAPDAQAKGTMVLDQEGNIYSASFSSITTPDMQLSLSYEPGERQEIITIKGERFRLNTLDEEKPEQKDLEEQEQASAESPLEALNQRRIDVTIRQVQFNDTPLRDLRFSSSCGVSLCDSLSFGVHYNERDSLNASIQTREGERVARAEGTAIATLIKALDISEDISGGNLSFDGTYEGAILNGRMALHDLVLKDAPILTKLLTLASLRGIADTLSGKGIAFDAIKADVSFDGQKVQVKKLTAKGDAMGVLLDGSIQPFADYLDLSGTVIPSYTLNSLPGKVPIIGELLVGGEDEGVFGTRFSVRGNADDPDVIVNPLSMLTPGFLRNIFDVFPDAKSEE